MSTLANTLSVPAVASRRVAWLQILSRALVAAIFLISAIGKLTSFGATVGFAAQAGMPAPQLAIAAAILLELAGGLGLLFGYQLRWATLALIVFLIPATLIFHASQTGNPVNGQDQMIHTLKNLAILGGLIKFYVDAAPEKA